MTERSRNLVVGAVTLLGILGLIFLLLVFGYVPRLLQSGYFVTIELPDASSLNPGSRVELSGIDIGQVETIDFKQPMGTGVTVDVRILDEATNIPVDAEAQVEKPLLGGSPKIRFVTPERQAPPTAFLKKDGSAVVTGDLGALAGAFGELERLATSIEQLSNQWQGVGSRVSALLEPQDPDAVEAGEVTGNVTTVIARTDRRLAELREVLAGFDRLINDRQLGDDITATARTVRATSGEVRAAVQNLERRYVGLADDFAAASGQLKTLLETANQPTGTLGRLSRDPALYNDLNDAAQRIGAAADELRLLIEKWKAEGVPLNL
ncbi:MAG: MlaD family protein [Planctomycetota bacterium]